MEFKIETKEIRYYLGRIKVQLLQKQDNKYQCEALEGGSYITRKKKGSPIMTWVEKGDIITAGTSMFRHARKRPSWIIPKKNESMLIKLREEGHGYQEIADLMEINIAFINAFFHVKRDIIQKGITNNITLNEIRYCPLGHPIKNTRKIIANEKVYINCPQCLCSYSYDKLTTNK